MTKAEAIKIAKQRLAMHPLYHKFYGVDEKSFVELNESGQSGMLEVRELCASVGEGNYIIRVQFCYAVSVAVVDFAENQIAKF